MGIEVLLHKPDLSVGFLESGSSIDTVNNLAAKILNYASFCKERYFILSRRQVTVRDSIPEVNFANLLLRTDCSVIKLSYTDIGFMLQANGYDLVISSSKINQNIRQIALFLELVVLSTGSYDSSGGAASSHSDLYMGKKDKIYMYEYTVKREA